MSDQGGSCTLIFYKIGNEFWREPFLNLVAAAFQMSSFTHVEIAIGDDAGSFGKMSNVCRVFNDSVGVELTSRTGKNPQYSYLQLGCSKHAEQVMLKYAKSLIGKPFSNAGMARSIIYPRQTTGTSFFCAELVAAILQRGGLMSLHSNPGAATPQSLHRIYKDQSAVTANPYTLRQFSSHHIGGDASQRVRLAGLAVVSSHVSSQFRECAARAPPVRQRHNSSPARARFKLVSKEDPCGPLDFGR